MKHTKLYLKTMRDDPREQVIWNQERPIAYLNCADANAAEFVELENTITTAPVLLEALKESLEILGRISTDYPTEDGWAGVDCNIQQAHDTIDEAIQKAKS